MNILSIDGGATRTRGVIFTDEGEIVHYRETGGTSLSHHDDDITTVLAGFVTELAQGAGLALDDVHMANIGVAGVSDQDARERLFGAFDKVALSDRTVITSDVEAAYEVVWADQPGVLVCVGTGAIGWAHDAQGQTYRASGRGPQVGGDPGSGYWMGKRLMVQLIMNEDADDEEISVVRSRVMAEYNTENFEEATRIAGETGEHIATVARLGRIVCELAAAGNDLALAVLQEGTQGLGEVLAHMIEVAGLRHDAMTLGMSGGIITRSEIYRRMLGEALCYDVPEIAWQGPEIDPVFGAALIAARLNDVPLDRNRLKESWSRYHLRATR